MDIKQEPQSLETFVPEKSYESKQSAISDLCLFNVKEEEENEVDVGPLKQEVTVELIAYLPTKSSRAYEESLPRDVPICSTSSNGMALRCKDKAGGKDIVGISKINKGEKLMKHSVTRNTCMKLHRRLKQTKVRQPVLKKKLFVYPRGVHFLVGDNSPVEEQNDSENVEMDATIHEGENYCAGITAPGNNSRKQHLLTKIDQRKYSLRSVLETAQTLTNVIAQDVEFQKAQKNIDKHGNRTFLLSFAPLMDSLPPHLYLCARMKISQVFQELLSTETFS